MNQAEIHESTAVSLDAIAADPTNAEALSAGERQAVMLKVATVMAAIAATIPREARQTVEPSSVLLTPDEAAKEFNVSKRWLLAHADEIPGARRLSKKTIRFNDRSLRRHLTGMRS